MGNTLLPAQTTKLYAFILWMQTLRLMGLRLVLSPPRLDGYRSRLIASGHH
jgi:hypothetical protein